MTNDQEREALEALVEENRNAFERAKHLLSAIKERSQKDLDLRASQPGEATTPNSSEATGRKPDDRPGLTPTSGWLDLERLVSVELGAKELPTEFIRCIFSLEAGKAWRPQEPGPQTIRLVFAVPHSIDKIRLVFIEEELERTHEFVLRWLPEGSASYREILRQQYVFSPTGSIREVEEYRVELRNLRAIELSILPDIGNRSVFASLAQWSLGASAARADQTEVSASSTREA